MSFYTNVQMVGDNLLYLGYENGQRIQRKFKFSPTLFIVTDKKTKHKTLDGRYAKPIRFESINGDDLILLPYPNWVRCYFVHQWVDFSYHRPRTTPESCCFLGVSWFYAWCEKPDFRLRGKAVF